MEPVLPGIVVRRLGVVLAILVFASVAGAADRAPARVAPPTTIQSEDPDLGEEGEDATPELRDEDDGFDDGRDLPSGPAHRPRPLPGEEEEEPATPPEGAPSHTGPAEPASAMQPASPQ